MQVDLATNRKSCGSQRWIPLVVGPLLMVAQLGCDPPVDVTSALEDTSDIVVSQVDKSKLNEYLRRVEGKVALVDFWATWCGPCTEKFPSLVALAEKFKDQGLVVLTVSLDESEQFSDVRRFLDEHKAYPMIHLISRHGASSESMDEFEIERGIPYLKLYDRGGRLRYTFGPDQRMLEQRIQELLQEPDPHGLSPDDQARIREVLGRDTEEQEAARARGASGTEPGDTPEPDGEPSTGDGPTSDGPTGDGPTGDGAAGDGAAAGSRTE